MVDVCLSIKWLTQTKKRKGKRFNCICSTVLIRN